MSFEIVDKRYNIILPNAYEGGMYTHTLYIEGIIPNKECSRKEAITDLNAFCLRYNINKIFAYNARFDFDQLPEIKAFAWYDILRIAAYRKYNHKISADADCYRTGRLKHGFGSSDIIGL